MGKKHAHEEHENHERWVISFADMMTLLFALFVVLYAQKKDELRETAQSVAFHLNFEGLSQSRKDGRFDKGAEGGQARNQVLIFSPAKGPMHRFAEVQAEGFRGNSLTIRELDNGWEIELPLAQIVRTPEESDAARRAGRPVGALREDRAEWLAETARGLATPGGLVRIRAECFRDPDGSSSRERFCQDRLAELFRWLGLAAAFRNEQMQVEFRPYFENRSFLGDEVPGRRTRSWLETGRLKVLFVR